MVLWTCPGPVTICKTIFGGKLSFWTAQRDRILHKANEDTTTERTDLLYTHLVGILGDLRCQSTEISMHDVLVLARSYSVRRMVGLYVRSVPIDKTHYAHDLISFIITKRKKVKADIHQWNTLGLLCVLSVSLSLTVEQVSVVSIFFVTYILEPDTTTKKQLIFSNV